MMSVICTCWRIILCHDMQLYIVHDCIEHHFHVGCGRLFKLLKIMNMVSVVLGLNGSFCHTVCYVILSYAYLPTCECLLSSHIMKSLYFAVFVKLLFISFIFGVFQNNPLFMYLSSISLYVNVTISLLTNIYL